MSTMSFGSFPELLACRVQESAFAQRTALELNAATWSYRELISRIGGVAGALRSRGLQRGVRVALLVERLLDSVAPLFGIMAAGGVVCPVEPRLAASDLALRMKSAGIEWLLFDRNHVEKARELS